jgi:hypothetical protein
MAFVVSMKSVGGSIECDPFVRIETCEEGSQDESDEGLNLGLQATL